MLRKRSFLDVVCIIVILAATLAAIMFEEIGSFGSAQGQENRSSTSLTSQQKEAICASVGSHVNRTESTICGIPIKRSSNATYSLNATKGAGTTSTGSASPPSDVPSVTGD